MSKGKVLVVEDEMVLRDVYKLILETDGYDVVGAINGKEGLKAVQSHQPNLVILDIFMPVMDGRDFLKNLDLTQHPDTSVIVCSNTSDANLQDEMLQLGADKIVLKADMAPKDLLSLVSPYFAT